MAVEVNGRRRSFEKEMGKAGIDEGMGNRGEMEGRRKGKVERERRCKGKVERERRYKTKGRLRGVKERGEEGKMTEKKRGSKREDVKKGEGEKACEKE